MNTSLNQNLAKYFIPEGEKSVTAFISTGNHKNQAMFMATQSACSMIKHFFSPINALRSDPVITVTPNSVIVYVFYYIPNQKQTLNNNTVNNLGEALTSLFNQPVQLRLIKQHYPYLNRSILAQWIGLNTRQYKLVRVIRRLFSLIPPVKDPQTTINSKLPSHIVGMKVQVSGRLMTERSRPRQTVQTAQIGSFSKDNLRLVDKASFTTKNKKGATTIKVWISQQAVV